MIYYQAMERTMHNACKLENIVKGKIPDTKSHSQHDSVPEMSRL